MGHHLPPKSLSFTGDGWGLTMAVWGGGRSKVALANRKQTKEIPNYATPQNIRTVRVNLNKRPTILKNASILI